MSSLSSSSSQFATSKSDIEKIGLRTSPSSLSSSTIQATIRTTIEYENNIVTWDGPNDPENPRNWRNSKRWVVTVVVSLFTFISPVASSMIAPSLPQVSRDLHIQPGTVLESMTLSIFVLAYALGPLIWGPLSELFGRLVVIQSSNLFFLVFNTACAFAATPAQMLAFRFLAGLGGAAPQSVGGGIVGDLWSPSERGIAMSVYSLAPLVGPSTGPLVGGWVAQKSRWQWVFWSLSIADGILQVAGFIFMRETYHPELLKRKARALRKVSGNDKLRSIHETGQRWTTVVTHGMVRPLKFLVVEPIVQVFAIYMALLYGILYLTMTTFVEVWTDQYGQKSGVAGIHYLAVALGSTVGGQVGARVLNTVYRKLKAKNGGIATPEMRLPLLMVTATTLPIGLLIFGWTSKRRDFWLLPDFGVFIFSIGIGGNWTCIQTYLVDNYALHAASAISGVSSFRALAGFGFPLFASDLYGKLGDGWGNTVLALLCLVIGCPAPFIFYRYGPALRARSKSTLVEQ
ncbi:MFS general substrate transporter [Rickenella mellea]|uniref:MFS general substrate transporter n=1 Tax=Rickenella mellea TaxID=50990 RepID=A0A4Y7Q491_9AGAM|nr:MFS general substrate transporter [Rickenella mellea]